jgi:DNA polymerase type B, organellar and viral
VRRHQHFLQGNKSVALPANAVWVDTETRPRKIGKSRVEHVLRFGWGCYQRRWTGRRWTSPEWRRFSNPRDFWRWVLEKTRPKTRTYVFAHNWSFDGPVLDSFGILQGDGWVLGQAVIESPPVILSWRKGDRVIEMLDTLNWWRVPLSKLGESIGSAKLPMPSSHAPRRVWDRYCRQDVEVIRRTVLTWFEFLADYDLGGFARTLAAQSLRAFRHRFMSHSILIDNHPYATALSRESYHGGRTECFFLGRVKGPIHVLDINSQYPAVMRDNHFPTVLRLFARNVTLSELRRWLLSKCVVARVELETDVPRFAHRVGERLCFPVGRLKAVLTTPDLIGCLKRGELKAVHEAAVYDRAPIFFSFVEEIYKLRQGAVAAGDSTKAYLLKILLNSLYGKFAQSGRVWEKIGDTADTDVRSWVDLDYETGERRSYRQFAGAIQTLEKQPESSQSHPAIASHVTAYARELLWRLMERAGPRNVYYCDTDSLWVSQGGLDRLQGDVDASRLGALKLEGTYPWAIFRGAKDYETPLTRKVKGVRKSARWLGPNTVIQEQWTTLTGLLRRGRLDAPETVDQVKNLSREYQKGIPEGRGNGHVSPFLLKEW